MRESKTSQLCLDTLTYTQLSTNERVHRCGMLSYFINWINNIQHRI